MKALPEFYGLGFADLGVLMVGLYLAMMLNLMPLPSVLLCGVGIVGSKILRKYFDFVGWLLPRKKEVFISDVKRGQG
jgi:hypothetical protein